MKFILVLTLMMSTSICFSQINLIKEASKKAESIIKKDVKLSESEIIDGLTEALKRGCSFSVNISSAEGGFNNNKLIKIPFPDEYVKNKLSKIGFSDHIKQFEKSWTLEKAIEYFSLGAEQNYTLAFYNLGVAYEEKNRILSSPIYNIYAVRWYKRAALRGNLKSMINLGTMLSREIGSVKDLKEAHKWVNISIAIKCSRDRLACKWSKELFEGPATPIINFLWDLRIEIERQMKPAQIEEAHTVAKRLILQNKFIREQIK